MGCCAVLLGMALFGGWAWQAGQDTNWDLLNYHDYAAYAFVHWRYSLDMAPGGWQSYFNPLPYLLPYGLRATFPPPLASMALALTQASAAPVAWAIARRLSPAWPIASMAALVGITSATSLSEAGTSFADLGLSTLVLGALLCLLHGGGNDTRRRLLVSGLLLGLAAGLKLTNGPFAVALVAAAIVPWRGMAVALRAAGLLCIGLLVGALLTTGAWCALLWLQFGNPVFPGFNTVFRSASAALINLPDARFLPHGILDAWAYPFRIALGSHPTAEVSFADPRFALTLVLCLIFVAWNWRRPNRPVQPSSRNLVRALVFLGVAFVAWLGLFSIARYAVALEILAGILAIQLTARLFRPGVVQSFAAGAVSVAVLVATEPSDWGHRAWGQPPVSPPPGVTEPAAFLMVGQPLGHWASALSPDSRFYLMVPVGLAGGGVLHTRLVEGLADPPRGQVWTLGFDIPMGAAVRDAVASVGFAPAAPCVRAPGLSWFPTIFCRATRVGVRHLAASDLAVGETIEFNDRGAGWIYEVDGWQAAGPDQTAAESEGRLVMRPSSSTDQLVLEFSMTSRAAAGSGVDLFVDETEAAQWTLPPAEWSTRFACLPQPTADGVITVSFRGRRPEPPLVSLRTMVLRPAARGECVSGG